MKTLTKSAFIASASLFLSACANNGNVCSPKPPVTAEIATLKADALFSFDKFSPQDMAPAGFQQLNEMTARLNDVYQKVGSIRVIGHTDRLGSIEYNQALSERRAKTVADYLRNKGVNANFVVEGRGESQPVQQCDDNLHGQALRDCLQPNRRVEIQVLGIKKQ